MLEQESKYTLLNVILAEVHLLLQVLPELLTYLVLVIPGFIHRYLASDKLVQEEGDPGFVANGIPAYPYPQSGNLNQV